MQEEKKPLIEVMNDKVLEWQESVIIYFAKKKAKRQLKREKKRFK